MRLAWAPHHPQNNNMPKSRIERCQPPRPTISELIEVRAGWTDDGGILRRGTPGSRPSWPTGGRIRCRRSSACGRERYSPGAERGSAAHTWLARNSKGGKGERRRTEGRAGRGAQRGRPKGGAPTCHGPGPPRRGLDGGERTREDTREETQQQKTSVAVSCLHAGARVKEKTKNQTTNQTQQRREKTIKKTQHNKGHTEGRGGGG